MRKAAWFAAAAAMFVLPAGGVFAQDTKPQPDPQTTQSSSATSAPAQEDSLAAAARKARDQKKEAPKAAKVFDNDSIPTTGGVSTVGSAPAKPGDVDANGSANPSGATAPPAANDEKTWRDRFATLHHKLDQDQAELGILEREAAVADVQYYNDPMKGMQQDLTRDDINKKTAALAAMKKTIEADKQAISDAEEALRKAGGDSGWAR
jgi:hypothetical protein